MRSTKAIIHLDSLRNNIRWVRKKVGAARILVPVKADAYGHGALAVAKVALEEGCYCLAVAAVAEGAELRAAGIDAPILLLSVPQIEELDEVFSLKLTPFVGDPEFVEELEHASRGRSLDVHIKIDTGMGRIGCRPEAGLELARKIAGSRRLSIAGTATHMPVSDSPKPAALQYTKEQLAIFETVLDELRRAGINPGLVHAATSGAVLLHPAAYFDMVRPGILLYGYAPAPELSADVEPVMELKTNVVFLKKIKKGESISYGRCWTAQQDTTIGTLPVGYGDGLPRGLTNRHRVLAGGRLYPLVGTICMDQCMVDLGAESPIGRWEEVRVFGAKPALSAADLAAVLGTIPYEICTNINKRVPRVPCE